MIPILATRGWRHKAASTCSVCGRSPVYNRKAADTANVSTLRLRVLSTARLLYCPYARMPLDMDSTATPLLPPRRSLAAWAALAAVLIVGFYALALALAAACVFLPYLIL